MRRSPQKTTDTDMALAILNHTSTSVETEPRKPPEQPAKPPMDRAAAVTVMRWSKRDTFLLILILLLAGGLRVVRLAEPDAVVFDETYYAKDACLYLGHSQDFCKVDQATEQSYVHPPLGKWLISLGIRAFGYNSFGWRFSAAIFGTAMAGLAYLLGRKLFKNRWIAAVAGLGTAVDLLLIVQSRIAMLDVFLAFFILLGFLFLVADREKALNVKRTLSSFTPGSPAAPSEQTSGETVAGKDSSALNAAAGSGEVREIGETAGTGEVNAVSDPDQAAIPSGLHKSETLTAKADADQGPPGAAASTAIPTISEPASPQGADHGSRRDGEPPGRGVGWRFAAGAAFGLAFAVKWSALLALGTAAICAFFWSLELLVLARRRRSSLEGPGRTVSLAREVLVSFSAFALVPALVYVGAYGAYFVDRQGEDCPFSVPGSERLFDSNLLGRAEGECIRGFAGTVLSFGDLQERIFDYHSTLKAKHSYQSKAWTWPLVLRPVAYFYESDDGKATEVMALGNVAVWYGALLALLWLVPKSFKSWSGERLVLVAWGAQYLPWLLVPRPLFFFYMTPAVPFMMLGLASALDALRRKGRAGRVVVLVYLVLAAGIMTAVFYPVAAGVTLPQEWWQRLMWIKQFDCGRFECGWI